MSPDERDIIPVPFSRVLPALSRFLSDAARSTSRGLHVSHERNIADVVTFVLSDEDLGKLAVVTAQEQSAQTTLIDWDIQQPTRDDVLEYEETVQLCWQYIDGFSVFFLHLSPEQIEQLPKPRLRGQQIHDPEIKRMLLSFYRSSLEPRFREKIEAQLQNSRTLPIRARAARVLLQREVESYTSPAARKLLSSDDNMHVTRDDESGPILDLVARLGPLHHEMYEQRAREIEQLRKGFSDRLQTDGIWGDSEQWEPPTSSAPLTESQETPDHDSDRGPGRPPNSIYDEGYTLYRRRRLKVRAAFEAMHAKYPDQLPEDHFPRFKTAMYERKKKRRGRKR